MLYQPNNGPHPVVFCVHLRQFRMISFIFACVCSFNIHVPEAGHLQTVTPTKLHKGKTHTQLGAKKERSGYRLKTEAEVTST